MSCADKEMKRSVVEEWYGQQLILFWWGKLFCVKILFVHITNSVFCNLMKEQELNTLKKKSPSDLWKEDLAVFIEELEVCVYKIYINTYRLAACSFLSIYFSYVLVCWGVWVSAGAHKGQWGQSPGAIVTVWVLRSELFLSKSSEISEPLNHLSSSSTYLFYQETSASGGGACL